MFELASFYENARTIIRTYVWPRVSSRDDANGVLGAVARLSLGLAALHLIYAYPVSIDEGLIEELYKAIYFYIYGVEGNIFFSILYIVFGAPLYFLKFRFVSIFIAILVSFEGALQMIPHSEYAGGFIAIAAAAIGYSLSGVRAWWFLFREKWREKRRQKVPDPAVFD